jgi:sugar phosphate permease
MDFPSALLLPSAAVFLLFCLAAAVGYLLTLQRAVAGCAPERRSITPGQVWLTLIPLFGVVWHFIVVSRLAESLEREFAARQAPPGDDYGRRLGVATASLYVAGAIPVLGVLFLLAGIVCWICYVVRISEYSRRLAMAPGQEGEASAAPPASGFQAMLIVLLLMAWAGSFIQRIALSVFFPAVRSAFGLGNTEVGLVFSSFVFGIMAGLALMSLLIVFCGSRWGLLVTLAGITLASLASGMTTGVVSLLAARFLLGLFTGGLVPVTLQLLREWFPECIRPLLIAATVAAGHLAIIGFPPLANWLARVQPWSTLLMLTALPSALAALLLIPLWRPGRRARQPMRFGNPAVLATVMASAGLFLAAIVPQFLYTWLPRYLNTDLHYGIRAVATASSSLQLTAVAGSLLVGALAWLLPLFGASPARARATLITACGVLMLPVALGRGGASPLWLLVVSSLAIAAYSGWYVLFNAAVTDVVPVRGVAVGAALAAFCGNLGAPGASAIVGILSQSGASAELFRLTGLAALVALLVVAPIAWLAKSETTD